jgi:hypothetical protein
VVLWRPFALAGGSPGCPLSTNAIAVNSEGMGYIIGSQKLRSCSFAPEGADRHEDYAGSITKFGVDLGLTRGGFMVWSVFTNTVAGPGFLAGDCVGASGQATT